MPWLFRWIVRWMLFRYALPFFRGRWDHHGGRGGSPGGSRRRPGPPGRRYRGPYTL